MQSLDLIETYAYGTWKDLVSEKEETECNNRIKQYKKSYLFDVIKENIKNIIQIDQKFLIIHKKY